MSFRRVVAHLLPALAYGGLAHSAALGLLLTRYHGYSDHKVPGGHVYYFDIRRHHWPALPVVAAVFALFVILPTFVSLMVAWRRPFISLESSSALVGHSITLVFSLLFNGYFCIMAIFAGWNQSSF